jgi:hypothetical protein
LLSLRRSADKNESEAMVISDTMTDEERFKNIYTQLRALSFHSDSGYLEVRAKAQLTGAISQKFLSLSTTTDVLAKELMLLSNHNAAAPRNFYVGRAPRVQQDGKGSSVNWVHSVSFDYDTERPSGKPASNNEMSLACDVIYRLCSLLGGGTVIMSGNGYQLIVPLDKPVDIRGRRQWWQGAHKAWEAEVLRKLGPVSGGKFDPQYDIPRVIKLAGTLSTKGAPSEDRPWRWTWADGDDMYTWTYPSEHILSFAPTGPTQEEQRNLGVTRENIPVGVPDRFWRELSSGKDPLLVESWRGTRRDIPDVTGSGQDMALANRLRMHGYSPEEAVAILGASVGGKKRGTLEYWVHTVEKAYRG